jgi:dynein heavy chain
MKEESNNQLVLFKDAIKYICRIGRVIRIQKGHMLLVGVGGSGRRTLTKLAATMSKCLFRTIEISKKYS